MPEVFTWTHDYPMNWERVYDETVLDLGSGVKKTAMNEIPRNRADGTGSVSSYKGTNVFTIRLNRKTFDGDAEFKEILDFLQARKEANNEAFYIYNPVERTTPDATGTDTTGRYLVQFTGKIAATLTYLKSFNYADLRLEEVNS